MTRSMNYSLETRTNNGAELGEPLSVYEVAELIGCSAWTIRQKHVREGLPCFRSGPSGRMIFYRNQVTAWILEKQKEQKGGTRL
jgi:phage terminase Nu1 subunit (DNA packaging protein)